MDKFIFFNYLQHMCIVKNIFNTPGLLIRIYKQLKKQKKYLYKDVLPILNEYKKNNDGSLDKNDLKKITHYYGLAVPAVLGEAFCILHGVQLTAKLRICSTAQGAMTGLFDDFFDKQNLSNEEVQDFIEKPITKEGNTNNEKLFLHFYNEALSNCSDKKILLAQLFNVYDAQIQSKKQLNFSIQKKEIEEITFLKGGESVLFYRKSFDMPLSAKEANLLFDVGATMQLCNDIFDLYKDLKSGVQTLISITDKVDKVKKVFKEKINQLHIDAYNCGFKKENAYKFLQIIHFCVFSRTFVCLNHLQKAEKTTNNIFKPSLYNRRQLICDMDKPLSILQSIKYYVTYCK